MRVPWIARRSTQSILKGDQSWVFIGGTDVEAETPILWLPDAKSLLIRIDFDVRKIESRRRRGQQKDEVVEWHH